MITNICFTFFVSILIENLKIYDVTKNSHQQNFIVISVTKITDIYQHERVC